MLKRRRICAYVVKCLLLRVDAQLHAFLEGRDEQGDERRLWPNHLDDLLVTLHTHGFQGYGNIEVLPARAMLLFTFEICSRRSALASLHSLPEQITRELAVKHCPYPI